MADIILVIHLLFVLFVVGGLPLIWVGNWIGLSFVRNRRFRFAHLAAILYVTAESLLGVVCPLTWLEDALRGRATETGFIERWLHLILFHDLPEWVFLVAYVLFALLVVITFRLIPPQPRRSSQ
ncbi:Protein of Unknown function [Nitrosospira multiformis]|uniref:DUF2784 domain-containing protein n=1 Tax=Nitrosospira multiformis TaxID=1231 RepID=A0A1I0F857_9PROT|nr:DUF2784 domain-containing protein [Nitrosospira multiformis]SET54065.1 Protein of Unknown function [Nitrosospira multiformis]